ncbi:MAG: hypothetical protein ACRDLQ_08425 [Solirubrobacterales bacterium]
MESREVFTQHELEEVLRDPGLIPICAGDAEFTVAGDHFVRAADSARLRVDDTVSVEAGGSATVVARGRTHVTARNSVAVDADDSALVMAGNHVFVRARGRSRVVAGAYAIVEAAGESSVVALARAAVRAGDRCRVRALLSARANLKGDARGWVWGMAVAQATQRAAVTAWGSANVFARDSASVEALETAVVTAGGSVTVRAFGSVMVRARGRARIDTTGAVAVMRHGPGTVVSGAGVTEATRPRTAEEWCAYYGVPVEGGVAILYKAVDDDFESYHGASYRPGSEPTATDWDGGEQECGGGLHFSPRPTFALAAPTDAMRFVACPVRLDDIAFRPDALYPDKVKARGVCAPVYEVREDGTAVEPVPTPAP